MNDIVIIAGFPGVGKSTCTKLLEKEKSCIDFESTNYKWIKDNDGHSHINPLWPANYVKAIKMLKYETYGLQEYKNLKYIFISTHKEALSMLKKEGETFIIVAPLNKDTAIKRYIARGSSDEFIENIDNNFDTYMKDLYSYGMDIIVSDKYLSNLLPDISIYKEKS